MGRIFSGVTTQDVSGENKVEKIQTQLKRNHQDISTNNNVRKKGGVCGK